MDARVKRRNWPAVLFAWLAFLLLAGTVWVHWGAPDPDEALDIRIHDTYYVVPETLWDPLMPMLICMVFAITYLFFGRITGRKLNAPMGVAHFISTFLGVFAWATPLLLLTTSVAPRRYYSYVDTPMDDGAIDLFSIATVLLLICLAGQLVFLFNIVRTFLRRKSPVA